MSQKRRAKNQSSHLELNERSAGDGDGDGGGGGGGVRGWWRLMKPAERVLLAVMVLFTLLSFSGRWAAGVDSPVDALIARGLAEGQGFDPGIAVGEGELDRQGLGIIAVMAVSMKFLGDSWPLLTLAFVKCCACLTLGVWFKLSSMIAGRAVAWMIVLAMAVNYVFLVNSAEAAADIPFVLGVSVAMLALEYVRHHGWSRSRLGLLILALIWCLAFRVVGLVVVMAAIAGALQLVQKHRLRWLVAAVVCGVVGVVALRLADPRSLSIGLMPRKLEVLFGLLVELCQEGGWVRLWHNGLKLLGEELPVTLLGNKIGFWPLDALLSGLTIMGVFVGSIAGGIFCGQQTGKVRLDWLVLLFLLLIQWILVLPLARYSLPILGPMLLGSWWVAVKISEKLDGALGRNWAPMIQWVWLIQFAVLPAVRSVGLIQDQHDAQSLRWQRVAYASEVGQWLNKHTPEDAVVVGQAKTATALMFFSRRRVDTGDMDVFREPVAPTYAVEPLRDIDRTFLQDAQRRPFEQKMAWPGDKLLEDVSIWSLELGTVGIDLRPVRFKIGAQTLLTERSFQVRIRVQNIGDQNATESKIAIYASRDRIIDPAEDYLIETLTLPALSPGSTTKLIKEYLPGISADSPIFDGPDRARVYIGVLVNPERDPVEATYVNNVTDELGVGLQLVRIRNDGAVKEVID